MVLQFENPALNDSADKTSDAIRSKAWRERQSKYLQELISASGRTPGEGNARSYMASLKLIYADLWAQTLTEAPASVLHHDTSLPRKERRRISSIKNNRLCRQRHGLFLDKIESTLQANGMSLASLTAIKGLRAP